MPLAELVDMAEEKKRLEKELGQRKKAFLEGGTLSSDRLPRMARVTSMIRSMAFSSSGKLSSDGGGKKAAGKRTGAEEE